MVQTLRSAIAYNDPEQIVGLIHEFVARYPKLQQSRGAVGRCKMASYELALFLRQRGIPARAIHVQGCAAGLYPKPHKTWANRPPAKWSHYVVGLGRWSIDMTARQFDASLGVPHMSLMTELRSNWRVVEEDKLINNWISNTVKVR